MPFTTNLSGTAQVPDALIQLWDRAVYLAAQQEDVITPIADQVLIGGKTERFIIYNHLTPVTSALDETEDVTSEAISEGYVDITPVEYGKAVTKTTLASLQTAGGIDLAAFAGVGTNMGRSMNKLGTAALEATTNALTVGNIAEGSIAGTDVMTIAEVNKVYNKLSRANVPTMGGGMYLAFAHDDVIHDIRAATGAGSWTDLNKYTNLAPLQNEVGAFGGFRWIRNNDATYADQTGAGTVDLYTTCFVGANALKMGYSLAPGLRITGPFDKLARMVNIGWYGVFQYKIYDVGSVWKLKTASSVGANAA